jgi:hypothetical protein
MFECRSRLCIRVLAVLLVVHAGGAGATGHFAAQAGAPDHRVASRMQGAGGGPTSGSSAAAPRLARVCLAGYLGGLAKYLVVQPLDTMTTLFEISRAHHRNCGLVVAMKERVVAQGLPSLLSGLKSTVMLALPYAIVFHSAQTARFPKSPLYVVAQRKSILGH